MRMKMKFSVTLAIDKGDHGADIEDAKEDDYINEITTDNIDDCERKNTDEVYLFANYPTAAHAGQPLLLRKEELVFFCKIYFISCNTYSLNEPTVRLPTILILASK